MTEPVIHSHEITADGRPLQVRFLPSGEPGAADTLIALPAGEVARPEASVTPPAATIPNDLERLRFRDEAALPKWWRLRPNLPTDPLITKAEHLNPALQTVELRITTPDPSAARGAVVTRFVHPEMAGDFIRAGWRRV